MVGKLGISLARRRGSSLSMSCAIYKLRQSNGDLPLGTKDFINALNGLVKSDGQFPACLEHTISLVTGACNTSAGAPAQCPFGRNIRTPITLCS